MVRLASVLVAVVLVAGGIVALGGIGRWSRDEAETTARGAVALPALASAQAAAADLRTAVIAMEAYRTAAGTYAGATAEALRALDGAIPPAVRVVWANDVGYCLESRGGRSATSATRRDGTVAVASRGC